MNIFQKVTFQNMKKSRTRTMVTIIGVILSTAMIMAVATFGTSLLNFLVNGSIVKYGGWHVEFLDVDSSFIQERIQDEETVSAVSFENIGYALLDGGKSPEKPYFFIAGFDEETFDTLPITLVSGRLPHNSNEVLIPSHVALKGGVRFTIGDTLFLDIGSRMEEQKKLGQQNPFSEKETLLFETEKTYTVVGICERPGFEAHSAPGYTLITKKEAEKKIDSLSLFVTLKHPRQAKAYASSIAEEKAYILNDSVLRFLGVSENKLFNTFLYTVASILVAIIMTGSVFLIYNSFYISLNERIRQFGILASVGATAKQLRNSVLFEGVCIGIVGIPIGILVGIGSIGMIIPIVARNFRSMLNTAVPLNLSVSIPAIVAATIISLITILISAYIPAKKAADLPIMESIRQSNEIKIDPKTVKISKLARRIYGLEGILALKNFKRNKNRYRSIVFSLILSVVLFVSGNTFGTTLKRISELYSIHMDYDVLFSTQNMDDEEMFSIYHKLKTADGVYESSYQKVLSYFCNANGNDFSDRYREYMGIQEDKTIFLPMKLQFIEDRQYLDFLKEQGLSIEEYTGSNAKMISVAKKKLDKKEEPEEIFDLFKNRSMDFQVSPEINGQPVTEQGQSISITFVDTYPVDPPPEQSDLSEKDSSVFIVVAPYSLKEKFEIPDIHTDIGLGFLSENPAQSTSEMGTMIQSMGLTSLYSLYNIAKILEQNHSMIFVIHVFTFVFVIMISLIAVANVFNTISTNIRLRRREFAMLRSIGMSDGDFQKMMHFECVFYGMKTLLFGLPLAGILSWMIYKGLVSLERIDHLAFVFPWGSMAISMFGVLFIVSVTMLYSIRKIKRETIIDALRDDMT